MQKTFRRKSSKVEDPKDELISSCAMLIRSICIRELKAAGLTENSNPVAIQAVLDRVSVDVSKMFKAVISKQRLSVQLSINPETKILQIEISD